jgi:hypothetical protein
LAFVPYACTYASNCTNTSPFLSSSSSVGAKNDIAQDKATLSADEVDKVPRSQAGMFCPIIMPT